MPEHAPACLQGDQYSIIPLFQYSIIPLFHSSLQAILRRVNWLAGFHYSIIPK
jgi:hypothetical protein